MAFVERLHLKRFRDVLDLGDGIKLREQTAPSTPKLNSLHLYAKDNGSGVSALYYKDDAGTEKDLSGGLTGTGAAGRVAFWSASTVLTGEANLYYDSTNDYLSIYAGSSPAGRLHVAVDSAIFAVVIDGLTTSASPTIAGRAYRGSLASPTAVAANDQLVHLSGGGYQSGGSYVTNKGSFIAKAGEAWTSSAQGTYLTFEATPVTTTTRQELMRMVPSTGGGKLLIGGGTFIHAATDIVGIELMPKATNATSVIFRGNAFGSTIMNFQGAHAAGTSGSPTASQADSAGTRLSLLVYGATGYSSVFRAAVDLVVGENCSDTAQGTYIKFSTTALTTTTTAERFRIGPSGQLGIGGATYGTSGQAFLSGGASAAPAWTSLDHGTHLAGLTDDDHTQYALLAGRSGGQTLKGGTGSGDDLTLSSTDHATKGSIFFGANAVYNETDGALGIGHTSPTARFIDIRSTGGQGGFKGYFDGNALFQFFSYGTGVNGAIQIVRGRGTAASPTAVQSSDILGDLPSIFAQYDASNTQQVALIRSVAMENHGSSNHGANLQFWVTPNAGSITQLFTLHASSEQVLFNSLSANFAAFCKFQGTMVNNGGDMYCLNFAPGLQPSANTSFTIGTFSHPVAQPPTGVTITNHTGILGRGESSSALGSITTGYGVYADVFWDGPKPTNSYAMYAGNAGATGVTTAVGAYVVKPTNATNNYYFAFPTADATAAGSYHGRIAVLYNGLTKYIHIFNA